MQTSADSCSLRMDLRILPVVWDPTGIFAVTTVRQPGGMLVLPPSKDQESETLFLEEYTSSPPITSSGQTASCHVPRIAHSTLARKNVKE